MRQGCTCSLCWTREIDNIGKVESLRQDSRKRIAELAASPGESVATQSLGAAIEADQAVVGPVFVMSDSRNAGYALTWVRAPNELYALDFFRTHDGVDVTCRRGLGPVALTGSLVAGETTGLK